MRGLCVLALACLGVGCGKSSSGTSAKPEPSSKPSVAIQASASASASASAPQATFTRCGPLDCRAYEDLASAFDETIEDKPLVVAVGEAHAKKGFESVDTAAKRFTSEIVPRLAGRTSDVLLELMAPGQGCEVANKATGKELGKIGAKQAVEAPNEYVTLGKAAEKLGIRVSQLHPSCKELDGVAKSKSPPVAILQLITSLSTRDVMRVITAPNHAEDKMFVIYGGAFHGEPNPPEERTEFSFAATLSKAAKGRYVSVHIFVREYIDATWDIWPWYPHFKADANPDKVVLFHPKPQHYVIITAAKK